MKYIYLFLGILGVVFFTSCSENNNKTFIINGEINGMPRQFISLEELNLNGSALIDTATSQNGGKFRLKGTFSEPNLYRVKIGTEFILVVVDNNEINISADWNNLTNYKSSGSVGTSSLTQFQKQYFELNQELLGLKMTYDTLMNRPGSDSLVALLEEEMNLKSDKLLSYIKHFSDTTQSLPVAIFIASKLVPYNEEAAYLQSFTASLPDRFEATSLSRDFSRMVSERIKSMERDASGPQIGAFAPDFTLPDVNGKEVKLSSFQGKYVLIDFWASWCPPCRAENPNVVAVYNQYKNRNFTILGVSLDERKEKWQEAIEDDKLNWTHVSDLRGWESGVAAAYGVQSIPTNFLLDPAGKIIAVNLRGDNLGKTIGSVLSQPKEASVQK